MFNRCIRQVMLFATTMKYGKVDCKLDLLLYFSVVRCSVPNIGNATYVPNQALIDYNSNVTYTCDLQFDHTAGDLVRTCQPDFSWSGTEPTCTRKHTY